MSNDLYLAVRQAEWLRNTKLFLTHAPPAWETAKTKGWVDLDLVELCETRSGHVYDLRIGGIVGSHHRTFAEFKTLHRTRPSETDGRSGVFMSGRS